MEHAGMDESEVREVLGAYMPKHVAELLTPWLLEIQADAASRRGPRSNGHGTVGDDSELELRVIPATEWKRGDDIYPMGRNPRGRCIIVNNCDFRDPKARRAGSELDVVRMECLFAAFHFECKTYYNLSACEMKNLLSSKAQEEQQNAADCLVVVLMSHGDRDVIYGVDDTPLPLDDVYEQFNNKNCPTLQGKPKLFFVQTCRGGKSDTGTEEYGTAGTADATRIPGDSASEPCARDGFRLVPSWSDMYICYASVPGYEALRDTATGAWFLSSVFRVFSEHSCTMHLEKLLHRVNEEMTTRRCGNGCCQTPSSEPRGWKKELYFNPGLFLHHTT